MENFIVSARKYRPATFNTVVGQKSLTTTLKNAIKNNHLAHAYLFCGPRGVGKTTCARIYAKTINCQNLQNNIEPCNECESCKSFNENRSYNIHELDAASNNSVEDIRSLIEQVRIPPQLGEKSVYIIDEVHMLSSQAFNAFLKTLEEPPKHAVFILATTEKHKILPTILSRCQIFDFNRIKVEDITEHLEYVAKSENIEAEHDALNIIAQKADGAMRDALSYFDQIVSFSGSKVSYESVIENLNVLDYDYYFKLTEAFIENKYTTALLIFNEILEKGFDGNHFITGLSKHFRDLLVSKDAQTIELLEVGASIKDKYLSQSKKTNLVFLLKALNTSNAADLSYKTSQNKRLLIELTLFNLCRIIPDITEQAAQVKPAKAEIAKTETKDDKPEQKNINKGSVSIKNALKGYKKPEDEVIKAENQQNKVAEETIKIEQKETDFSQEQLLYAWQLYANSIKSEKPRLNSLLKSSTPKKADKFKIIYNVINDLQKQAIAKEEANIIAHLCNTLNNDKVNLEIIIKEENVKKQLYTDTDKYKYLNEKNANLNKLKQQFNLDF
ncbi:MAG: DNA polymerase III subunit gamma/tau [Bacteroidetes bacterium 4572_117]|nr:MAG: DNA polymerase III subunit gamma/tau [Bacteroidetes bacterium 4572_117]